jgi:hypothetical protein
VGAKRDRIGREDLNGTLRQVGASREPTSKLGYNGTCAGLTLTTPRVHEIDQQPASGKARAKTLALVD